MTPHSPIRSVDKCASTIRQQPVWSLAGAISDHVCAIAAGSRHGLAGQRFETPEAAWDASWKEGQRLVKLYQAELQVGVGHCAMCKM